MMWVDTNCLVSNVTGIKELKDECDECEASDLLEVSVLFVGEEC